MRVRPQKVAAATKPPVGQAAVRGAGAWVVVLSILFWLIFYMNLPGDLNGMLGGGGVTAANTGNRLIKFAMLGVSLCALAAGWFQTLAAAKNINVGLAALLLLCPLSAMWSIAPDETILRYISLLSVFLVCFAISVCGWQRKRFQHVVIPPVLFILAGSLLMGMMYPNRIAEVGTDISQMNAWHGITHSKNEFGMVAAMGMIVFMNGLLAREGRAIWSIAGAAVAGTCLMLSRSHTSMFSAVVGVGFMVLVMRLPFVKRSFSTQVVTGTASTILLYEMAIQNVVPGVNTLFAPILGLTGKDTTFSARTIIWAVVKEHIQGAPYLGTGYGAYWLGPLTSSPSYVFVPMMNFYPTEAHNGYLDIVNDLGLLGLMFLLVFLAWFIYQGIQLLRFDRSQAALYLGLLFQEMVINMSESDFFSRTNTFSILMLATLCLSRALAGARTQARSNARVAAQPVRMRAA
jgi:O-antigen ligase